MNEGFKPFPGRGLIHGLHGFPVRLIEYLFPSISNYEIDVLNRYVDVFWEPNVYSRAGGGVNITELEIQIVETGTISNIEIAAITAQDGTTKDNATLLVGGETVIRVWINVFGNASGTETFIIKPAFAGAVVDSTGNKCPASTNTGEITLEKELDAMYKAVILTELNASEAVPTRPQRLVENALFVSGRSAGWLTELDALFLASLDQNHILYNFVTGTKIAAIVGTPVLTKFLGQRGAASSYIDFNWNPAAHGVKYLQNDRAFICVITNNAQSSAIIFGARGTDSGINFGNTKLSPRNASDQASISTGLNNSGNELVVSSITDSIGVYMGSRNAASGTGAVKLYKDGSEIGADIDASSTPTTRDYYGNTQNPDNGTPTINQSHDILAWAWGSNLRSHAASIGTVFNQLRTDLASLVPNIIADKLYSGTGQSNGDRADLISNLTETQYDTYIANGAYLMSNGYDANCYVWWDDEWQAIDPGVNGVDRPGGYFSPLYALALEEADKYPGEDLYFIWQCIGGTGMKNASGGNNWIPGGVPSSQFEMYESKYNSALAELTSVTTFMPMYWFQGEADAASTEARALEYEASEQAYVAGVIASTGHNDIIVMQIHSGIPAGTYPHKAIIIEAKENNNTNGEYGTNGVLINIDDLERQAADPAHLTNSSSIILAQRMSAAYP